RGQQDRPAVQGPRRGQPPGGTEAAPGPPQKGPCRGAGDTGDGQGNVAIVGAREARQGVKGANGRARRSHRLAGVRPCCSLTCGSLGGKIDSLNEGTSTGAEVSSRLRPQRGSLPWRAIGTRRGERVDRNRDRLTGNCKRLTVSEQRLTGAGQPTHEFE